MRKVKNVDDYIARFTKETQKILIKLRTAIKKSAPKSEEIISYSMPAYKFHGIVAYFAGHAHHVGFYTMPGPIKKFKKELTKYKTSKGTVQFPIGKPISVALVSKMIKFRIKENLEKKKLKS